MPARTFSINRIPIIPHLPFPMRLSAMMAAATLLLASPPLRAQAKDTVPGTRPGWSVNRAMRELTRDFGYGAHVFFPRRGTWDYVSQTRDHTGAVHRGILRVPAEQTRRVIYGPLCEQFLAGDMVRMGSLVWYAAKTETHWRRVSPTRFEPREPDPDGTVFVDWRLEDGRWVIASFGNLSDEVPPPPAPEPPRDPRLGQRLRLPLPADGRYAGEMDWYRTNEPIEVGGRRATKASVPRPLQERDLVYFTTYDGVEVYTEPAALHAQFGPEVIYVPVDRTGLFQPYMVLVPCD